MGAGHLSSAAVFSGLTEIPSLEITCPRYYTDEIPNLHFFLFSSGVFEAK